MAERTPAPKHAPKGVDYYLEDGTDPRLPPVEPDVLVTMGRDMIAAILRHPEKYEQTVMRTKVFVVDDASYESLFYFFSGKTRTALWEDDEKVAALFLKEQPVLSHQLFHEALRHERGW